MALPFKGKRISLVFFTSDLDAMIPQQKGQTTRDQMLQIVGSNFEKNSAHWSSVIDFWASGMLRINKRLQVKAGFHMEYVVGGSVDDRTARPRCSFQMWFKVHSFPSCLVKELKAVLALQEDPVV